MVGTTEIFAAIELTIGLVAVFVASIAWNYRNDVAGVPVFIMLAAASGYAFASGLNVFVSDPLLKHLIHNLSYPFTTTSVVAVLYLLVEFTHREKYHQKSIIAVVLGSILFSFIVSVTDPIHNLIITEPIITASGGFVRTAENAGPLFWAHGVSHFGVGFVGFGWLVSKYPDSHGIYRQQMKALILAYLITIVFFLWQTLFPPHPAFDVATVGLLATSVLMLWALFYSDFLGTMPIPQRTLLNNVSGGVIALDRSNRVLDLNRQAKTLFDLDDTVIGDSASQVFQAHPELAKQVDTTDEADSQITIEQHGNTQYYNVRISPIVGSIDNQSITHGRLLVFQDITQLVEQRNKLEETNKRLDQFAGIVSHDLRNPLSVAEGWTEMAEQTGDSDHFENIRHSHARMKALIDDLLALARDDDQNDHQEQLSLAAMFEQSWKTVDTADATCNIETDTTLCANSGRLQQLIENLIRNAIEHGGESVTITVGDLSEGFYIEDDGSGVSQAQHNRLFDAGYTTAADGTGLGLAIVEQITDDHNWDITGTDGTDGGLRFEITGVESTTT